MESKFILRDGEVEEIYYNSDSNSGGQIVLNYISFDLIEEAVDWCSSVKDFFEYIDGGCRQYLIDKNDADFEAAYKEYLDLKDGFENKMDLSTMQKLKKAAGIEFKNFGRGNEEYLKRTRRSTMKISIGSLNPKDMLDMDR